VGLVPALASWFFIKKVNQWTPIPLRETPSAPLQSIRESNLKPESELPSFFSSILPIILPILLISADSAMKIMGKSRGYTWDTAPEFMQWSQIVSFIGNKNFALIIGALLSLWLLKRQSKASLTTLSDLVGPPLETGGVIILITSAGGAFGYMLSVCGVKEYIEEWAKTSSLNVLVIAYLVAVILRVAQGSATVAMQTTAAMVSGLIPSLYCDPIYLFLTIGFGAFCASWMNDSGFWVVSRLSGFTEKETLRTWTVTLTFASLVGFAFTLLMSYLWKHPL
jgi:gluconate:H+ symporter, GntP family